MEQFASTLASEIVKDNKRTAIPSLHLLCKAGIPRNTGTPIDVLFRVNASWGRTSNPQEVISVNKQSTI